MLQVEIPAFKAHSQLTVHSFHPSRAAAKCGPRTNNRSLIRIISHRVSHHVMSHAKRAKMTQCGLRDPEREIEEAPTQGLVSGFVDTQPGAV